MTEDFDNLSTLVGDESQSSANDEGGGEVIAGLKINPHRFRLLCDNVQNCFYEIDKSMFEMVELKDKLLLQYLPRSVLLHITFIFSRFFRAYSVAQVPVYELIRLVQMYSEPFDMKWEVLKRLYESNETKKRMLNLAFQKLTSMEHYARDYEEQRCLNHWEKMYIRLATPRGNVRKWKFRIRTFREKAELGYEHVIEWIETGISRPLLASVTLLSNETGDDQNADRLEIPDEIENVQEINESTLLIDLKSSDGDEISSIEKQTTEEPVTYHDIEIQAQPDFDHQQTSTEDILSTKSLIMRIYRPIGIAKTKFQCIVDVQGRKYPTKMLTYNFSPKSTPRMTSRFSTPMKKHNEESTTSENNDINTIDKQQTDELIIPMPNVLTRRSLFQTNIDPDAIKIEIFADEHPSGSLVLSSEDLRMLDLPTLYSPILSPFIALEDDLEHQLLDLDQSSNQLYHSWISRTPPTFSIYNNQHLTIGRLPLLLFWYEKLENQYATKSTMTDPMEIREPTPPIEMVTPSRSTENDEETSSEDQIEIVKANYENEIVRLHEIYQSEIHRLTTLLNQVLTPETTQVSESAENTPEIHSDLQTHRQTKQPDIWQRPPSSSSLSSKDLPKNFLDRYEMYLQRSLLHRHELTAKIEQETALANERQMEFQHRLHKPEHDIQFDDDLCLPAVFMPFRSGSVINPRAYQYFHPVGSTVPRLTQAPSILKFPSLPPRSFSVLNLFELSRSYEKATEKNHSTVRPTTQTSD